MRTRAIECVRSTSKVFKVCKEKANILAGKGIMSLPWVKRMGRLHIIRAGRDSTDGVDPLQGPAIKRAACGHSVIHVRAGFEGLPRHGSSGTVLDANTAEETSMLCSSEAFCSVSAWRHKDQCEEVG